MRGNSRRGAHPRRRRISRPRSTKLRELSQPITNNIIGVTGERTLEVTDAGGGLIRLTPTEAATNERIRQTVEQSIPIIEKRVNELGLVEPTVQRQGIDRILVQVPGLGDPQRLIELIGKTAKLEFRLVNHDRAACRRTCRPIRRSCARPGTQNIART